jgi:hypothetical protein
MNVERINPWLTFISNLAVVAGIIFLAVEINQNSEMITLQVTSQEQQRVLGRYIESPDLAIIEVKLEGDISPSGDSAIAVLVNDYGLTQEEARRWVRYMVDQWLSNSANWQISGDSDVCRIGAAVTFAPYNRMIFDYISSNTLSAEYIDCVKQFLN